MSVITEAEYQRYSVMEIGPEGGPAGSAAWLEREKWHYARGKRFVAQLESGELSGSRDGAEDGRRIMKMIEESIDGSRSG